MLSLVLIHLKSSKVTWLVAHHDPVTSHTVAHMNSLLSSGSETEAQGQVKVAFCGWNGQQLRQCLMLAELCFPGGASGCEGGSVPADPHCVPNWWPPEESQQQRMNLDLHLGGLITMVSFRRDAIQ